MLKSRCKQYFGYLQFYLYSIGEIMNKQRTVCDKTPGSSYNYVDAGLLPFYIILNPFLI